MVDDDKEPSPLHQQAVEKIRFTLHDNHLTIEPFNDDIDHISEMIKEYVTNVEYRVSYYKDELTDTQFRLEEPRCWRSKLENDLAIKTEAHITSVEQ